MRRIPLLLGPVLILVACRDTPKAEPGGLGCETALTWYQDADGDGHGDAQASIEACEAPEGHVAQAGDCDDEQDSRNPSADEVCDGIDNDCDEVIDDGSVDAPQWFIDYDHDGYGSPSYSLQLCEQPAGYVDNEIDCDDTSALALPGGSEVCDGLDNDCDGEIDGPLAGDVIAVYPDEDGDGFGDEDGEQMLCARPEGWSELGGDCEDSLFEVNPDAIEICDDGIDNDCDGGFSGCAAVVDDGAGRLIGADGDDRAGISFDRAGDLNGDGAIDLVVGAYQAGASAEGEAYVLLGPISAGDTLLGQAGITIRGSEGGSRTGWQVGGVGDFDGDGLDDVVVTATVTSDYANRSGSAWLFSGATLSAADPGQDLLVADADYRWSGSRALDWVGAGLTAVGDANGDGFDDFAVGATGATTTPLDGGAVYLILGSDSLSLGGSATLPAAASLALTGEGEQHYLGNVIEGPGDLDGDGIPELVVGSGFVSFNGPEDGAVYIASTGASGSFSISEAEAALHGGTTGDRAGAGFASPGDLDGDGYNDLWAGAGRDDEGGADAGAVFLLPGAPDLGVYDGADLDSAATAKVVGNSDDAIGGDLEAFDLDADGEMDLVIGVGGSGLNGEGAAWVLYGPLPAGLTDARLEADAIFVGDASSDHVGTSIQGLGDLLGTGEPVLGVGAWEDDAGGLDAGTVFLLTMPGL